MTLPRPAETPLRPVENPPESLAEEDPLAPALLVYPAAEREAWRRECLRLHQLLLRYAALRPKRQRGADGNWEFTAAVRVLCEEVGCQEAVILLRAPRRAAAISPYTLDDWYRQWRQAGLRSFLPPAPRAPQPQNDGRFVALPAAARE